MFAIHFTMQRLKFTSNFNFALKNNEPAEITFLGVVRILWSLIPIYFTEKLLDFRGKLLVGLSKKVDFGGA